MTKHIERSKNPARLPGALSADSGAHSLRPRSAAVPVPDPSHHQRRCKICRHPDRQAIEQDFLDWRNPCDIAEDYKLSSRSTLYRHAHATGLYALRRCNFRSALENIIERSDEVEVTASSIVRAVRACTRINDDGEWVEPPRHVIITHLTASVDPAQVCGEPGRTLPNQEPALHTQPPRPDREYYVQQFLTATTTQTKDDSTR